MAISIGFLFLFISTVSACSSCVYQGKAAYLYTSGPLSTGACGYGSLALGFNGGYLAAGGRSLFKNGVGCGACFQIRCKDKNVCCTGGTKVVLSDHNGSNQTEFVLSNKAYRAMAQTGKTQDILDLGIIDVEYKRVPCVYKQNLAIRVEESSQNPYYLALKVLYQGGQTDIALASIAQVGTSNWIPLSRSYGAVWDTNRVPTGPLQIRFVVQGGYDGLSVLAPNVLPADWRAGAVYDAGVQISAIANVGCPSRCHLGVWK